MTITVLFCHHSAELYGSDRMAVAAVAAMTRAGMDVTVALPVDGPLVEWFEKAGATVVRADIPSLKKGLLKPRQLLKLALTLPAVLGRARRLIKTAGADVVYANTIVQPWWILAARLSRRPVIAHVREAESEIPVVLRYALSLPVSFSSAIICNSRATEEYVHKYGLLTKKKSTVVYNGKDWSTYFRSPFVAISSAPHLLFVGRLNPRKGPDIAIRALGLLVSHGVDARLTIAGSVFPGYEWYEEELRALTVELDVSDRCDFAGFVTDSTGLLESADIVVVPSRVEPFGTVAAEAMAAERPTVVSDVQGLVEIVDDRRTGLVFPAGDPRALADACVELIEGPELALRLARAGRSRVADRFSLQQYDTQIVQIVQRLAR